jgi:hypothetical protein
LNSRIKNFALNALLSMPSRALRIWQSDGRKALDEIEAAHRAVGGSGRGRRYATQQINQAYVVLLLSQFQRFCRDLHEECVEHLVRQSALQPFEGILIPLLVGGRKLDAGNPNPGNIGSDFGRLGIAFWRDLRLKNARNEDRQFALESLNRWRNAIAHQDFRSRELGGRHTVRMVEIRRWRNTCERLAVDIERLMHAYLLQITGSAPW